MPRTKHLFLVVLAAAALGAPAAASATAGKPALAAKLTACTTGDEPAGRAATFTASMPALAGTDHMDLRFTLLQRRGTHGRYKVVDVPDWAQPERSEAGRPGFVFTKRIGRLLAPAAYRARVTFAWYDAKGHVQRRTRRTTAACFQPDPRPNLRVAKVVATANGPKQANYAVTIVNDGGTTAGRFGVALGVGDIALGWVGPIFIGPLAAGTPEIATLTAPRCEAGSTIVVSVDPDGAVDESREDDDVVQRPCPTIR